MSNLAAACQARLVATIPLWVKSAPAAAFCPATVPALEPYRGWTSAFDLACQRAMQYHLSPQQRKDGADCATLLVASGQVGPMDRVGGHDEDRTTAFEAAAQAGLTDICTGWSAQALAQPQMLLDIVLGQVTKTHVKLTEGKGKGDA